MCRIEKPALVRRENAPVVSTYLTVVDGSCIMKTSGREHLWLGGVESYRHRGSHVLGSVYSWSTHCESSIAKDCTVVYGDRRGIASATTVLDAGAVHGL